MASRCGCASSKCSCTVQQGPGVNVTGTGSSASPYVITATNVVTFATGSEPSLVGVPDGTLWVEYTP